MTIARRAILIAATVLMASPALAQGPWKPGDKIWGKPYYEQWSQCVILTAQANANVQGGMQYDATCQIISNGKYVPTHEVLTATMTKPFALAAPAEASGAAHMVLVKPPRPSMDCGSSPKGKPGAPDLAVVRSLIQCRLETNIATGDHLIADGLSIRAMGSRPWRVGYTLRSMPGGQGGDIGGGGPGTKVYLFGVDATVKNYTPSGLVTTPRHDSWECFYAQSRWTCGLGS